MLGLKFGGFRANVRFRTEKSMATGSSFSGTYRPTIDTNDFPDYTAIPLRNNRPHYRELPNLTPNLRKLQPTRSVPSFKELPLHSSMKLKGDSVETEVNSTYNKSSNNVANGVTSRYVKRSAPAPISASQAGQKSKNENTEQASNIGKSSKEKNLEITKTKSKIDKKVETANKEKEKKIKPEKISEKNNKKKVGNSETDASVVTENNKQVTDKIKSDKVKSKSSNKTEKAPDSSKITSDKQDESKVNMAQSSKQIINKGKSENEKSHHSKDTEKNKGNSFFNILGNKSKQAATKPVSSQPIGRKNPLADKALQKENEIQKETKPIKTKSKEPKDSKHIKKTKEAKEPKDSKHIKKTKEAKPDKQVEDTKISSTNKPNSAKDHPKNKGLKMFEADSMESNTLPNTQVFTLPNDIDIIEDDDFLPIDRDRLMSVEEHLFESSSTLPVGDDMFVPEGINPGIFGRRQAASDISVIIPDGINPSIFSKGHENADEAIVPDGINPRIFGSRFQDNDTPSTPDAISPLLFGNRHENMPFTYGIQLPVNSTFQPTPKSRKGKPQSPSLDEDGSLSFIAPRKSISASNLKKSKSAINFHEFEESET